MAAAGSSKPPTPRVVLMTKRSKVMRARCVSPCSRSLARITGAAQVVQGVGDAGAHGGGRKGDRLRPLGAAPAYPAPRAERTARGSAVPGVVLGIECGAPRLRLRAGGWRRRRGRTAPGGGPEAGARWCGAWIVHGTGWGCHPGRLARHSPPRPDAEGNLPPRCHRIAAMVAATSASMVHRPLAPAEACV